MNGGTQGPSVVWTILGAVMAGSLARAAWLQRRASTLAAVLSARGRDRGR